MKSFIIRLKAGSISCELLKRAQNNSQHEVIPEQQRLLAHSVFSVSRQSRMHILILASMTQLMKAES